MPSTLTDATARSLVVWSLHPGGIAVVKFADVNSEPLGDAVAVGGDGEGGLPAHPTSIRSATAGGTAARVDVVVTRAISSRRVGCGGVEDSRGVRAPRFCGTGEPPVRKRDNPAVTTESAVRAGRLGPGDSRLVSRLLDREPVINAYLRSELRMGMEGADWWGVLDASGLRAAALGGALVVPCIPEPRDAVPLGDHLSAGVPPRMLVGPRPAVLALHSALARTARDVRDPQHLMAVGRSDLGGPWGAPVRRAWRGDVDALVVAAAAMHREEMGIDPLSVDAAGWRARMTSLVDRGWSFVWQESGTVVFKAELSAWTPGVVQIQGVWTHPERRRQGLGSAGLATVCRILFEEVPLCSLYVNHFNSTALRLYKRLGFRKVAEFATVIY